jgi:type VI secretion system secreted protein Hcp|tara:strand:- start:271 stop:777 length:507 start_codon:yes stop_codon:yes gene_type:complete
MPMPAYMSIEGVSQGPITEGCTGESAGSDANETHEDEFQVQAFKHTITIPRDIQTGQPTGPRRHGAMTVTKCFDSSSPLLYNALCTGERLECEINWFRISDDGEEEHYFTMELEGAVVVDITAAMANVKDLASESSSHMEEVSISYKSIKWVHEIASTEGEDKWGVEK